MSETITYESVAWVLDFPTERPDDYVPPTEQQRKFLRSVCAFYALRVPRSSVGTILMYHWCKHQIELSDDWEVMRHPIFIYQNYCEMLGLPDDTWDTDFDPVFWSKKLRENGLLF